MKFLFQKQHKQHIFLGSMLAVLASLCVTSMGLMIKLIGDRASLPTILFSRFFLGLLLILPSAMQKPKETLKILEPYKVLLRCFFSLMAIGCFYYSLRYISLTNSLLLNNTSALFVPLIVLIFHRINTSATLYLGVLIGFLGIAFVLKPGSDFLEVASFVGLASGLFAAIAFVSIRFLTKNTSVMQLLFYYFLIGLTLVSFFLPLHWVPLDTHVVIQLVILGILGFLFQLFNTLALAKAPARLVTSLQFLSIIFGILSDYAVFGKIPDLYSFIGITLVIFGGILTIYAGKKEMEQREK